MNREAFGLVMMLRMRLIWHMSVPIRKGKGNGRGPISVPLQVTSAPQQVWSIWKSRRCEVGFACYVTPTGRLSIRCPFGEGGSRQRKSYIVHLKRDYDFEARRSLRALHNMWLRLTDISLPD